MGEVLQTLRLKDILMVAVRLEMGSWLWIKKNPRQLLSLKGIFNPLIQHRQHRVLRRHLSLLDFLARATFSHGNWVPTPDKRAALQAAALQDWYE